jgi:hypothetical protein
VEAAWPVRCLETNVYATPTAQTRDLEQQYRSTKVFTFLLKEIRPRVIFVHGKDARMCMQNLACVDEIELWQPVQLSVVGREVIVLAGPHLSRGWSRERARQIGNDLRDLCLGQG